MFTPLLACDACELIVHQIEEEIANVFDFMKCIYGLFGFEFHLELSTRPEKYLGQIETWNLAEEVFYHITGVVLLS